MKNKSFIALTLLCSVVLFSACTNSPTLSLTELLKVNSTDIAQGPSSAPVTLIEYSDFQCPYCSIYHPLTEELVKRNPDKLQFVYRYFPLTQIHQNALNAAKVAQAASLQGKFSDMANLLFKNQKDWSDVGNAFPIFEGYAKQISLDMDKFSKDFNSNEVLKKIQTDYTDASRLGLDSTPTFFLNGQKIQVGPQDFIPYVQSIIDSTPTTSISTTQAQTQIQTQVEPSGTQAQTQSQIQTQAQTQVETNAKIFDLTVKGKKLVSGPKALQVMKGDQVTIHITSDEADEFHLHGYDLSSNLEKDKTSTLSLKADVTGRFTYELEKSKVELGALEVSPQS